jgi:triosephosphate isomerase
MRKIVIAGNWKMNLLPSEAVIYFGRLYDVLNKVDKIDKIVCPPYTHLAPMADIAKDSTISLGAQNMYFESNGAFTGEISPDMLKDIGIDYVILGHSERRHIFGETDEIINKKLSLAMNKGLTPIFCIGELLEEREGGNTFKVITRQLTEGLKGLDIDESFLIAYEPVWAIGTGKTASTEQAQEVISFIRKWISDNYSKKLASNIRILYGGSVKPENIESLLKAEDIDGGLVGGASLKYESWVKINEIANKIMEANE